MGEPTRLKAIAAQLNLSQSTVSRALNDYQDISARTKQLVREVADELGYQPNMHARRLALGKSETLGYVMPWQDRQATESFLSELMAGMAKALAAYGWDLTVLVPHSVDEELELFQKIARTRHISGLVISRTYSDDRRFQLLRDLQIPFVSHGRSNDSNATAWLDVDNELAFAEMTAHFASLGHRRIAHIAGPEVYNFARQRTDGWRRGIGEAGLDPHSAPLEMTDLSFEGGKAAMQRLLALDMPPTAVCCVSDVVAIGAMQAIREAGLVPGREVSLVGYDGLEIGAWIEPPLTTMRQPQQSAGRRLAEMLISLVEGRTRPSDNQELVRASLVRRETANPPVSDWSEGRQGVRQTTRENSGGF
jgi:LacI family transcriptional regulator